MKEVSHKKAQNVRKFQNGPHYLSVKKNLNHPLGLTLSTPSLVFVIVTYWFDLDMSVSLLQVCRLPRVDSSVNYFRRPQIFRSPPGVPCLLHLQWPPHNSPMSSHLLDISVIQGTSMNIIHNPKKLKCLLKTNIPILRQYTAL